MKLLIFLLGASFIAQAHDVITTPITWDREISRIVYDRCVSCHHVGGSAFSLMSYSDIRPWAESVKEEVLARTMPPWGAIKGFGDFRDDQGLTAEQIEIIANWANGGVPEGDPKDLPRLRPRTHIKSTTPGSRPPCPANSNSIAPLCSTAWTPR
jgi:hypothetical protein